MAEVLGTVVGVVSLGIQVCSGVNTYLDGIQCRKDDIDVTKRHCALTETLLDQLKLLQTQIQPQTSAETAKALEECIISANVDLSRLGNFVAEINPDTQTSSSGSFKTSFSKQKKKLVYPFKREHLNQLDHHLDTANRTLQAALQLVDLQASVHHQRSLQDVSSNVTSVSQSVSNMNLGIHTSFQEIQETTTSSHTVLLELDSRSQESSSLLSTVHTQNHTLQDELAEVKALLLAISSPDPRQLCQRMISKPDALRRICDLSDDDTSGPEEGEEEIRRPFENVSTTIGRDTDDINLRCRCRKLKITERWRRQLGPAALVYERSFDKAHFDDCAFARFNTQTKVSWNAGISVKALRGVLRTAVAVTTASSFGAGGHAISPSFTYYALRGDSPAFRIIQMLEDAWWWKQWSGDEFEDLVRQGIKALQTCFVSKSASVLDLDSDGHTLLHAVCKSEWALSRRPQTSIVGFLLNVGVPAARADHKGSLPFQAAFESMVYQDNPRSLALQAVRTLCPETWSEAETQDTHSLIVASVSAKRHKEIFADSSSLGDFYVAYPARSIILRNMSDLLVELENDSFMAYLSAKDPFGNLILHHLLSWPEGLETVLHNCPGNTLELHEKTVEASALYYALVRSVRTCVSYFIRGLNRASEKARNTVIDDFARRRQQLQKLGARYLEPQQAKQLGVLDSGALDQATGEVIKALEMQHVCVPPELFTQWLDDDDDEGRSTTVYHEICRSTSRHSKEVATRFYAKGFHAIDSPDHDGFTPLQYRSTAMMMAWLIRHGADLGTQVPGRVVGYTAAHHACLHIADNSRIHAEYRLKFYPELFGVLRDSLSHDTLSRDSCDCGCSNDGCHPYSSLWRYSLGKRLNGRLEKLELARLTDRICTLCRALEDDWEMPRFFRSISVRACTFHALDLRHTCCTRWSRWKIWDFRCPAHHQHLYGRWASFDSEGFGGFWDETVPDEHETREVREEDADELEYLEDLLLEFEQHLEQWDGSLTAFFRECWSERMFEAICEAEDQDLTPDDLERARRIGVNLEVGGDQESDSEERDSNSFWLREIDACVER
ncbi:hypothetical protein C8035_v004790 [Colletotrichum spinosum]|uniref:Fungal N-terminal domain-containing protein n=1 Tax=Colletotrichum spinosum TaxID=1347390 RepID=A0A4R8QV21_9PEZI|nr:hypothetical protein C8035_v004790 [Colletotrichum spinosum]